MPPYMGGDICEIQYMENSQKVEKCSSILWISYPESTHSVANAKKELSTLGLVGGAASHPVYGGESVLSTVSTPPTNITKSLSY